MDRIYIKILAERVKQDSTLLDKLPEDVRTKITAGEITQTEVFQNQVPEKITKLQLKVQLVTMGYDLQIIENAIKTLPEPQKTLATLSWTEATNFYRDNDMIASVGQMLNLTSEQIDELFIEAEKIRL